MERFFNNIDWSLQIRAQAAFAGGSAGFRKCFLFSDLAHDSGIDDGHEGPVPSCTRPAICWDGWLGGEGAEEPRPGRPATSGRRRRPLLLLRPEATGLTRV